MSELQDDIDDSIRDILTSDNPQKRINIKLTFNHYPQNKKLFLDRLSYFYYRKKESKYKYRDKLSPEGWKRLFLDIIPVIWNENPKLRPIFSKNAARYGLTETELVREIGLAQSKFSGLSSSVSKTPKPPVGDRLTTDKTTAITGTITTADQTFLDCMQKATVAPIDEDTRVLLENIEAFISDFDSKLDVFLLQKRIIEIEATIDKLTQPKPFSWGDMLFEVGFSIFIPGGLVGFLGGYVGGKIIIKLGRTVADGPWGRALTDAGKDAFKQGIRTIIKEARAYKSEGPYKRSQIIFKITEGVKKTAQLQKCSAVNGYIKKEAFAKIRDEYLAKKQFLNSQKDKMNDWLSNEFDSAFLCNICIPGQSFIKGMNTFVYNKKIAKQRTVIGSINAAIPEIKSLLEVLNSFYLFLEIIVDSMFNSQTHYDYIDFDQFKKAVEVFKFESPMIDFLLSSFLSKPVPDPYIRVMFTVLKDNTDQLYFAAIESTLMSSSDGIDESRYWYLGHLPPLGEQMTMYLFKNSQFISLPEPKAVDAKSVLSAANYKDFETGSKKQTHIRTTLLAYLNSGTTTK